MQLKNMITVVGVHTEGEANDVITGGVLPPRGATMYERMANMERESDWIRKMILFEPRGGVTKCVNLITPPIDTTADIGMIVMESDFYVPMSGSNLICTVTAALETGMLPMQEPETKIRVDTPAGLVDVVAECRNGKCRRVTFRNVPCFVMHRDVMVDVPGMSAVRVDVVYGGMIYAIVKAEDLGFRIARDEARDLVAVGERIKAAAAEQVPAIHPENQAIHTINQTQFAAPVTVEGGIKTARNAVIVSPGRIDRSPCGTGTSARLALMRQQGMIEIGEMFRHVSIIDTFFNSKVVQDVVIGGTPGIVPEISGRGFITGISYQGVDPEDPFPEGYRLADTWFQ